MNWTVTPQQVPLIHARWLQQTRAGGAQHILRVSDISLLLAFPFTGHGIERIMDDERWRLTDAPLYFVTADMTEVAVQAGLSLPKWWHVRREDLPSDRGFVLFEHPYGTHKRSSPWLAEPTVLLVGAAWGPTRLLDNSLMVTFYSATINHEGMMRKLRQTFPEQVHPEQSKADIAWDSEVVLLFDSSEIRTLSSPDKESVELDPAGAPSDSHVALISAIQTLRAVWLMMKSFQRRQEEKSARPAIAEIEELPQARKTQRRQAEREGQPLSSYPVQVVRLHSRPRATGSRQHASGYKMKVRTWVKPHVRWQHYPSRGVMELIEIDPYVRGPEGAPFTQKPIRVNVLDRPPGGRPPVEGK